MVLSLAMVRWSPWCEAFGEARVFRDSEDMPGDFVADVAADVVERQQLADHLDHVPGDRGGRVDQQV
jgi:hypothetical protein